MRNQGAMDSMERGSRVTRIAPLPRPDQLAWNPRDPSTLPGREAEWKYIFEISGTRVGNVCGGEVCRSGLLLA